MTTRVVTDPSGVIWRVRRRWIPHNEGRGISARLKKRRRDRKDHGKDDKRWHDWIDVPDVGDGCGDEIGLAIAAIVAVIVIGLVVALLIAFGPGLILIGIDLAWFVGVFLVGIVARFVFRRPWLLEATSSTGERRTWAVQGFRAAARARDEIAGDLAAGLRPRGGEPV